MEGSFEKMATQWLGGRAPSSTSDQAHRKPGHARPARQARTSDALPYHDTGSLIIDKTCDTIWTLRCAARLSGVGEVPELSEAQPVPHPSFALAYLPASIMPVADSLLETDMVADPQYAGWSPGSTSLEGYAREITFWRREKNGRQPLTRTWLCSYSGPSHSMATLITRWEEGKGGFGEDWTEMESYQELRALIGPSNYSWLDPREKFKVRHQIEDLSGQLCQQSMPSLQDIGMHSLTSLLFSRNVHGEYNIATPDVVFHLLQAHMLTRLLERDRGTWHGGITSRVVLSMAAAEVFAKHIEIPTAMGSASLRSHAWVRDQQLDGIIRFVRDMAWPFAHEIIEGASQLRKHRENPNNVPMPFLDWLSGLVLAGRKFSGALILSLYTLSPTLQPKGCNFAFSSPEGHYGILYPKTSYWGVRSIVGKVMAPLSLADARQINCLAGWVGPCPTTSVRPVEDAGVAVMVGSIPPTVYTATTEADEYARRGIARIPPVPSDEIKWIEPEVPDTSTESASLQGIFIPGGQGGGWKDRVQNATDNLECHFWLNGSRKVMFRLLFNSVFLSAPPCQGIHRFDSRDADNYSFRIMQLSNLVDGGSFEIDMSQALDMIAGKPITIHPEKKWIKIINATSGGAAESFARAWCSYVGTSAVIWKKDAGRSCFKCALMTAGREGLATNTLIIC